MAADLHCHSVISDGSAQIGQILDTAERLGLDAIAITDHDDFSAHNSSEVKNASVSVIKGAEISARDFKTGRRVHVLCYLPKNADTLEDMLRQTRENRKNELRRSIEIIGKYYPVTFDMLEERRKNYGGYFKQHLMQILMELGYCNVIFGELFYKLFSRQNGIAPTHVVYPDVYDVLEAIKGARGTAVLAHPAVYDSFDLLKVLCNEHLIDGIEVDHPKQSPQEREYLASLADRYGLLKTGGTDFHGYNTSQPKPLGTCTTSNEQLKKLLEIADSK